MKVIIVIARYVIFLFRGNFFHYNVMIFYYSINSPLSQFSPNLQQKRSVFSVCRRRSVSSKRAPKSSVNSVRSVRDKPPHCEYPTIFLSQKITEEQNTQHSTETLSQPISQSVTANLSWKASVTSVCRRRSVSSKCAPKGSVNSVRSVRDKTPHCESQAFFSHRFTQKKRTHKGSQRH